MPEKKRPSAGKASLLKGQVDGYVVIGVIIKVINAISKVGMFRVMHGG